VGWRSGKNSKAKPMASNAASASSRSIGAGRVGKQAVAQAAQQRVDHGVKQPRAQKAKWRPG
jgi:hypothetical protein